MKKEYFVYHGYINCDNYDEGICHELSEPCTESEALAIYDEWLEENDRDDNTHSIIRIIKGVEVFINPVTTVTSWKIGEAK